MTHENLRIRWDDPYGRLKADEIAVEQYRFCLTALSTDDEIAEHALTFGPISLGFSAEFMRRLGAFPVFYLPSPMQCSRRASVPHTDNVGISVMYRLAEIRSTLEAIGRMGVQGQRSLTREVVNLENALGAVRFLGNILYPTDNLLAGDDREYRYYNQREWRIIAGLLSPDAVTDNVIHDGKQAHVICSLMGKTVASFIEDVALVGGDENDAREIGSAFARAGLSPTIRVISRNCGLPGRARRDCPAQPASA